MQTRRFGRTGWEVSEIGFGSWAIGADWGNVEENDAIAALNAALDHGVSFIDTADVYGDGRAEKLIAKTLKARGGKRPIVATKAGKRLNPHVASGYNRENLTKFVERSLKYLEVDTLDLVQLHCPMTEVFYQPDTFAALDALVREGKIRHYGVSVEKVEEGIKALQYPASPAFRSSTISSANGRPSCSTSWQSNRTSPSSCACRSQAACSPASSRRIPASNPAITATTTGMAKHSTWARPSPASITSKASPRSRSCARWCRPAPAWRNSRCAGS